MTLSKARESEQVTAQCAICQGALTATACGLYTPGKDDVVLVVCQECVHSQTAQFFLPHAKSRSILKILADLRAQFGALDGGDDAA